MMSSVRGCSAAPESVSRQAVSSTSNREGWSGSGTSSERVADSGGSSSNSVNCSPYFSAMFHPFRSLSSSFEIEGGVHGYGQ